MPDTSVPAPFPAYKGAEPYIFVSYAHVDAESIFPDLLRLHKLGYRIWYDQGIDPGKEWTKSIAKWLDGAAFFVVFISPKSVLSENVLDEIQFAKTRKKPRCAIHLSETSLPADLELTLGRFQAILKHRTGEENYWATLLEALPTELRDTSDAELHDATKDFDASLTQMTDSSPNLGDTKSAREASQVSVAPAPGPDSIGLGSGNKKRRKVEIWTKTATKYWLYSNQCIALSQDGTRIASGCSELLVFEVRDSWPSVRPKDEDALKFEGHRGTIMGVTFSPDGSRVVSGAVDGMVKIWEAKSGQEIISLQESGRVYCVAFSPDGMRVVSGSDDMTVKVWDGQSGKVLATLRGHCGTVMGVAYSPDGRSIVSASNDKTLKIWDTESGKELATLKGHLDMVCSVAYSPDGKSIVSGSRDKTVKVWDPDSGRELATMRGHGGVVKSVGYSHNGKKIVSGSWDMTVRVWDAVLWTGLATLEGHCDRVVGVAFFSDGRRIVSTDQQGNLIIWSLESKPVRRLRKEGQSVAKE